LLEYLKSKEFLKHLLWITLGTAVLLFLIQLSLRLYTHHGQKIQLTRFIGMEIGSAISSGERNDFEIVVSDSVFIVGKTGGIIIDQNPKPGAFVKEGRKIYVTVTKFGVETIRFGDLPPLYGNGFEQKKAELKYRDIDFVIKDYAFDPGEPDHILEVWYNGALILSKDVRNEEIQIAKGSTLECIVSKIDGGDVIVPDLVCLSLDEANFLLSSSKLQIGEIIKKGQSEPDAILYISSQIPPFDGVSTIAMGEKITVTVSPSKPPECN
jgi:beta-lactam-binding protein with PASTA domain